MSLPDDATESLEISHLPAALRVLSSAGDKQLAGKPG
jgi:hypothetical protein